MELWEARCAFARAISQLVQWASYDPSMVGFQVAFGEGYVALTDGADGDHDGPHKAGGAHYTGLGFDLLVYENGRYVSDGDHPAYQQLGAEWKRLHWLARWGGEFAKPDANHMSFEWGGKS